MAVYIITGKLGGGKTLIAVGIIRDALKQGRKVATNIDLWLEHMLPWKEKSSTVYRLPDGLKAESFEALGCGNDNVTMVRDRPMYDEEMNGIIVLDEGALSMNARDYRQDGRQDWIRWCVHSRKKGWDVYIIVQHFDTLDKQIRDMFGEHIVYCIRWDRMAIPLIGWALQLVGLSGKGAKVHFAVCRYGQQRDSPVAWRKTFKGADLYFAYDTRQQYYPGEDEAVYQLLPPWYIKGRHEKRTELNDRLSVIWESYINVKIPGVFVFFCAMAVGFFAHGAIAEEDPNARISVLDRIFGNTARPKQVEQKTDDKKTFAQAAGLGSSGVVSVPETREQVVVESAIASDPWLTARLSTLIRMPGGRTIYKFKTAEGDNLPLPKDATFRPYSDCSGQVLFPDRRIQIKCRPEA